MAMENLTTPETSSSASHSISYRERFETYFSRDVAEKAAHSISDGSEIEFRVETSGGQLQEVFTFTRQKRRNAIKADSADAPQVIFTLTPDAAEQILSDTSEEIGSIGVNIAKLVVSADANKRVGLKLNAGFLTLFSKGYFGVITAGGSAFASYLASHGLNGMGAIKAALSKLKS